MTRAKAIKPPYVQGPFRARGQLYCFFRKPGSPRIPLPLPLGSEEFWAAYQAALADVPRIEIGASRTKPGTLDALIVAYYQSAEYMHALSAKTRATRRGILERFRASRGDRPLKLLEPKHLASVLNAIEKPHVRRAWFKTLRGLMKYAAQVGMVGADPTRDIRPAPPPKTGGHKTWREDHIAAFRAAHPLGTQARLCLELLLNTVQRRGDVIRMGRQHMRNGRLHTKQRKTGVELTLPVLSDLAEAIAAAPSRHLTFLVMPDGKPFADNTFAYWFSKWCAEAGVPPGYTAHGLRKAGCVRLAHAGCTAPEIAAWSGHLSLSEVQRYIREADQLRLADAAASKLGTSLSNIVSVECKTR
jgi:integrase